MDGDLQNDPVDIPRMVARLLNEDLDLVAGWRQNRQDGLFLRKIPSEDRQPPDRPPDRRQAARLRLQPEGLPRQRDQARSPVRRNAPLHSGLDGDRDHAAPHRRGADDAPRPHGRRFQIRHFAHFPVILDLIAVYFFMRFAPALAISSAASAWR